MVNGDAARRDDVSTPRDTDTTAGSEPDEARTQIIVTRHKHERPIGGFILEPEGHLICRLTGAIRAALRLILAASAPHLPAGVQEKHLKPH